MVFVVSISDAPPTVLEAVCGYTTQQSADMGGRSANDA